ncbi:AbrB/MazE/SpoVT family DNA-binding domain-containing protein [Kytococcus sedentarius]|nr:AbrB/MazE/SpoVT family DNA-binding domain-containing protein [Kytococcus sedentarius]QQB63408.1 AbrB/MazE/SpoVT family DNA-binding domain-containing protein [Kytococcus sedentarius]QRO87149.1 AbrB/MazE/SpoVT family DNA-binding domain-containing protein [Kytococcus sedentarius]STX13683.1 putative regulator PrlF [Kytococcus sedentarius]
MVAATMTSKGQVTVPKEVRDALHLTAGSRLVFEATADGGYLVRGVREADSLAVMAGRLRRRGPAVSLVQMDGAIASGAAAGQSV